jgi:two-component system NtrC family sensor kinase
MTREELLAADLQDVLAVPDPDLLRDASRQLRAEGHALLEGMVLARGGPYPAEIHLHTLELGGRPVILGVARDITVRRQAQEDLKKSLSRLQATLESTVDGILVVDVRGRICDCNQQFARMWNLPEGLLAQNDDDLALDYVLGQLKTPETFQAKVRELYREPTASSFDVLEFWDGRVFERYSRPQFIDGVAEGRVWCFRDITERRRTEREMQRLSQAVAQSPASIVITDIAGAIEFVNPCFTRVTGYQAEEVLGRNPRILKSGLTPPAFYEELWTTLAAGRTWDGEFQNRRKGGELFWEHARISPILDDHGVPSHYMAVKEDITSRKQLQHQLRHSQKLEAVGQLAGGVAHDFNNILQVINGYGTLLQMTMPAGDPNRAGLSEILKAGERAAHLTHSLLAFSRKQVMNPKVADLNTVVANVEKFLRRVIGEDVQLQSERCQEPLKVRVDIGQIEQVLMNLATNARDAMETGGCLSIRTEAVATDGVDVPGHGLIQAGRHALLSVTDTGKGMDEATQKRIFDPFYTTKEMGRGTGLGLAIVYGIIKQHTGYITVQSDPERGTSFRIYLPLVEDQPCEAAGPEAPQGRIKGTETILVAEDEPAVRAMMEMILRKYGYNVILAQDGQEAVDQFQRHQSELKLLLMDIIMPRKSGRQAYDEIRRLDPAVKVLFTSGYTADFIKDRGELDQGMELVMKPVQPLELLRKVRELLDRD